MVQLIHSNKLLHYRRILVSQSGRSNLVCYITDESSRLGATFKRLQPRHHFIIKLLPLLDNCNLPTLDNYFQDRLVANDFIQCRKVAEHVVEKIVGGGDVNGASAGGRSEQDSGNDAPEERIELLCCDQVWHTICHSTCRNTFSFKTCFCMSEQVYKSV